MPARYAAHAVRHRRAPRGSASRVGRGALAAVVAVAVVGAAVCVWYFTLRDLSITVNGSECQVARGTTLTALLDEHDSFGVRPGRLLSINGSVLDEEGGARCTATVNDGPVASGDFDAVVFDEGDTVVIGDGADVTEEAREEEQPVYPNIQMQVGGAVQYVAQWGTCGTKRVEIGEVSGETRDIEVIAPATDMVVASINPAPVGGPFIALTFDDGPSAYTPAILDVLCQQKAHATFFNLGNQAGRYPDICRRIVDEGHELASHTNAHSNLPTVGRDELRQDITAAFAALEQASGARTGMIRAPYGAFTEVEWARAGDIIATNVLWNIDTLDWSQPGPEAITKSVLDNAYNGAIVLMHDGGGDREQTVQALKGIIEGLQGRGFKLVTVSELLELDGRVPAATIQGDVTLPEGSVMPAR